VSEWARKISTAEATVILAFLFSVTFAIVVFVVLAWFPEHAQFVLGALVGTVNAVVSYYFGGRKTRTGP